MKSVLSVKTMVVHWEITVKENAEKRMKALLTEQSYPPLNVIIPILEKSGRGEQELTAQLYDTYSTLAKGMKEILGLKDKNMKTLAKVFEISLGFEGLKFEPIEISESRFSLSIPDCPMLHVGKDVSFSVKSKFCDLVCTSAGRAFMNALLSPKRGKCTWDKALIKGSGNCRLVFELVEAK